MRLRLHTFIFIGMGLGVVFGIGLSTLDHTSQVFIQIQWVLDLIGKTIFVGALKMLVAPLIFASIVAGVTSLGSFKELGKMGGRTLAFYFITTSIAVTIGLILVNTIRPGNWKASAEIRDERTVKLNALQAEFEERDRKAVKELQRTLPPDEASAEIEALGESFHLRFTQEIRKREDAALLSEEETRERYRRIKEKRRSPLAFVRDIVATTITNPFYSLTFGSSLGIIFFALLLGTACIAVGEPARPVTTFFQSLNAVIMKLTSWVMTISPFAVMCLMASLIGEHGPKVFGSLAGYIVTVISGILVHVMVLLAIVTIVGKISPIRFIQGIREAWLIAFSTRSSAATLPVTIRCVKTNLGVKKKVSEFVLPIGATVNMDGTALYEGVAVIYLIQMFGSMPDVGITLSVLAIFLIFITAVLASVGAAAVPDAGLITMVLVANAVGLPEYYLIFIFSVDAFLDMFRTSTNVMGDSVGAVVINRFESR
ncbi:dicarboxylate/amino acid:cation symporter [Acidobacteriota bacterium]